MAYTTIDDPSAYFHVNLHSGNGTNNTDITFDANAGDFQPDWVWFKGRTSSAIDHALFDSSRGTTKILNSNNNNAENAQGATLKAFNSNGFRVGDDAGDYGVNASGRTYVTWNWKANGGTTASNTDGTITSTVQANTDAGFSIISYTGNGSDGATIGHGLSQTPQIFFPKCLSTSTNWEMYYFPTGGTRQYGYLNLTNAFDTWPHNAPSSTIISLSGSGDSNGNGRTNIGYAFHSVQGYSKIGTYTGNGNADGPFVYTGFKPRYFVVKRTDSADDWNCYDSIRSSTGNPMNELIYLNTNGAETADDTGHDLDFLSNGVKLRTTNGQENASGGSYIYMAFAEHPFVSSEGVPTTAR